MPVTYDILILEIENVVTEAVRVWGKENIKSTVYEFKRVYNLAENDDYVFYVVRQSKMNFIIERPDVTHKKVKNKL